MEQLQVELILSIIKSLRAGVTNYRIYPAGSKMVIDSLNLLYSNLQRYFQLKDTLIISETQNKMLINGEEVKALSDPVIMSIFADLKLQSITFKKELTLNELSNFIEIISKRKVQLKTETGVAIKIPELLKTKNVKNILLDEIKYVAIKEGEEIVTKISSLVGSLSADPAIFMKSLREVYDSLDELKDEKIKQNLVGMLAKKLASLDPTQLKEFFDRTLPTKIEQSGLREAVINALPQEKIQEILNEIIVWYEDIKKTSASEFEAVERLSGLRQFLNKILTSPQARNIPFRFFEELLRIGVLEELPMWVKKEEPSLILQVDKLLEADPIALLDPQVRDSLPGLIKQLCQSELTDVAEKLTNKFMENLKHNILKVRSDTTRTLLDIFDILVSFQKEKILKNIESSFMSALEREVDIEIYRDIINLLTKRVVQLLLNNVYENALGIIGLLKQRIHPGIETDTEKRNITREYFTKLAGEISGFLVNEMKSGIERRQKEALKVIVIMEDTMSNVLIEIIKDTDDYRTRRLAAIALKNIGEKAVRQLVESLDLTINTQTLKRIIQIFDEFTGIDLIDKVTELLEYPDREIKKLLIKYLKNVYPPNNPDFKNVLINKLKDTDIVVDVVKILGEIKCTEALDELIELLEIPNTTLQEEICIALGFIGDSRAIPVLVSILKTKKSLFGKRKNILDTVRMRAAYSLRNFPSKEVEKILSDTVNKDRSAAVKSIANQSLIEIRKQLV
ncbi:MAG: HEAT repeat domain-containing protein [Elusimicrobiota bacterium]|nr:HEAT repeat domain-containing protein [Elusimicrobiota bacterium]